MRRRLLVTLIAASAALALPAAADAGVLKVYTDPAATQEITSLYDFGNVAQSTFSDQIVYLRNTGSGNDAITGISATGTGFTRLTSGLGTPPSGSNCATTATFTLNANTTCALWLRFTPGSLGLKTGGLGITSSTSGSGSPVNRSLQGTGVADAPAAEIRDTAGTTPRPAQAYGDVATADSLAYVFTLRNTGNVPLTSANAVSLTGANPGSFSLSPATNCPATLNIGASCTITVNFVPAAVGAVTANLQVVTGNAGTLVTTLSGTGVPPAPAAELRDTANASPHPAHDFGVVSVGTSSAAYTYRLRNTGNNTLQTPNNQTITGANPGDFTRTTTCGATLAKDATCDIVITFTPTGLDTRNATLSVVTANAGTLTSALTGQGNGVLLQNDVIWSSGVDQKRWLDSSTIGGRSGIADHARMTFEVATLSGRNVSPDDVLISTTSTTNDTAPADNTFVSATSALGAKVSVSTPPGGSTRKFIETDVSMSGLGGWDTGVRDQTNLFIGCTGGTAKTNDRRIWVRFRDSSGALSSKYGSRLRVMSATGLTCGAVVGLFSGTQPGPALHHQAITAVGGVAQPANTQNVVTEPGVPVDFVFQGRDPSGNGFTGLNWRIRNSATGAMFIRTLAGGWTACASPCATDATFIANGDQLTWPGDNDTNHSLTVAFPTRGHWIVEGAPQGTNSDDQYFSYIGSVEVNSPSTPTFDVNVSTLRPNTNGIVTLTATGVTDLADPIGPIDSIGGRGTNIEWDLDGDDDNGPGGDGFESRSIGDPITGIPTGDLTRTVNTTGKTPGVYTIRARVTDNGGLSASDPARKQTIVTKQFVVNSPPEPTTPPVVIDVDDTQPRAITLTAEDADGDPYTYDVTDTTMVGEIHGTNVNRTYTWPTTWTGIDEFPVVASDDHNGSKNGTLEVRVHPNTTIDSADPTGAVQQKDASFTFSSPQTPVDAYECRLLRSDYADQGAPYEVVTGEDWTECANASTGSKSYADLPDGDYRFEVRAINPDDLEDLSPATHSWRVDNTPPEIDWRSGPIQTNPAVPAPWNDPTPTYQSKSIDRSPQAAITYECRVLFGPESGNWKPCGSPSDANGSAPIDLVSDPLDPTPLFGLTEPLAEGTYEFEMRATDEVGLVGAVSKQTFKIDLTPPGTSIASGPDGLINVRTVDFAVTSTEAGSTFQCTLTGEDQGVIYPTGPCPGGAAPHFENLADDVYTFTVASIDPATNVDPAGPQAHFEIDATEPTTELDSAPPSRTQSRHAEFVFHGADARQLTGFQCRLDSTSDDDWTTCQSPESYGGLSDGEHTLDIRAVDEATNVDSTPEHVVWVVDRTAPKSDFDVTPTAHSNDPTPTFEFSADESATFECKLDSGAWGSCTTPHTTSSLADGPHTFSVRGTDLAGNVEVTARDYSWSVDTVTPDVQLNASPTDPAPAGDAEFGFDVTDGSPPAAAPEVATECSFDGGAWEDCTSPFVIADPANGPHTFAVRAIDEAGNVSSSATHGWTVQKDPPVAPTIDNRSPAENAVTRSGNAAIAFSHPLENEPVFARFECRTDDDAWKPCESPYTVSGLDDGAHEIAVRARDVVGNASAPAVHGWVVNSGVPVTHLLAGPSGLSRTSAATFSFSSDKPGATFECKRDADAWAPCTSPASLTDVGEGEHTFRVRAVVDATPAPLKDPNPPSRQWSVDTVVPGTTITSAPTGLVPSLSGTVVFNSDDPGAAFQCKLAGEDWDACTSPADLKGLPEGSVHFEVRAVDKAGNADASPATAEWTAVAPAKPEDETPPQAATGDNAINATLTGGSLKLGPLDPLALPVGQIILAGQNNGGTVSIPAEGVNIKPLTTQVSLGASALDVKIILSATGPATGTIPPAGGAASLNIPLQAKVEAYVGGSPVLGATSNCILGPLNFNLTGSYDAGAKKLTLGQSDVSVPTAGDGCGALGGQVNSLLGLPSNANSVNLEFSLGQVTLPPENKPPDTQPPTIAPGALALGRLSSKIVKNVVSVPVTCKGADGAAACSGEVRITTKVKSGSKTKVVTLAKKSYAVRAGKKGTVKLKLPSSALKRLKAAGKKGLKTSVEIWPKGSKKAAAQKSLTLKQPGGRK